MRNPSRGWIATANNKIVGDDYPYPISHYYAMPDRFARIQEMISAKEKFDVKDFERMQADFYVILAKEWVPILLKYLSDEKLSEKEKKARSTLKEWDFVAAAEDIACTVFHAAINEMVKNTFKKRLGDALYGQYIQNSYVTFNAMRNLMARGPSPWFDDPDTPEVAGVAEIVVKSFKDAVAYLDGQMGGNVDDWIWGKHGKDHGTRFNIVHLVDDDGFVFCTMEKPHD